MTADKIGDFCKALAAQDFHIGYPKQPHPELNDLARIVWLSMFDKDPDAVSRTLKDTPANLAKYIDSFQDLRLGHLLVKHATRSYLDWVQSLAEQSFRDLEAFSYSLGISVSEVVAIFSKNTRGNVLDVLNQFITKPDWLEGKVKVVDGRKSIQKRKDEIILALQAASVYTFPLTGNKYDALIKDGFIDGPSKQTVAKVFGTWTQACLAAGVESGTKPDRSYDSKWSDVEIAVILNRCRLENGGYFPSVRDYEDWASNEEEAPSSATLRVRFGSWGNLRTFVLSN